ncbi:hypothetical protein D8S78_02255 [Natrialba swarupiae]|nr:hypothetical protein [Natrialba swarupiae]
MVDRIGWHVVGLSFGIGVEALCRRHVRDPLETVEGLAVLEQEVARGFAVLERIVGQRRCQVGELFPVHPHERVTGEQVGLEGVANRGRPAGSLPQRGPRQADRDGIEVDAVETPAVTRRRAHATPRSGSTASSPCRAAWRSRL